MKFGNRKLRGSGHHSKKRSDITENRTVIRMRVPIFQDYEGLLKPEGNVCTLENEDLES